MASAHGLILSLHPFGLMALGNLAFSTLALDASGDRIAFIFQAETADAITSVGFRYGIRTGTPPTYRVSLQGVNGSGEPDGTVKGGGSPASQTFTPPADASWDNSWRTVTLANSYTPSRGELLALVIDYSSGTINGSNFSTFTYGVQEFADALRMGMPYNLTDNSGSWTKQNAYAPIFAVYTASDVVGFPIESQQDHSTDGTNTRVALKFTLPAGWGSTFEVLGLRFTGTAPGGTWTMGLWNAAGTALQSVSIDGDVSAAPGSGLRSHQFLFDEATLATLDFGTTYYLGIERNPTDGTISGVGVDTATEQLAFPGGNAFLLSRWNGSAWSDTTTTRPCIEPILNDWTEPSGGSGGVPLVGGGLVL